MCSTDDEFLDYINFNFYPDTPRDQVSKFLELYPADPAAGAPYNSGDNFAYSPQYKRMAAFQGDFIEVAPRRRFTQHLSGKQPVYAYCELLYTPCRPLQCYSSVALVSNFHKVEGIGAVRLASASSTFPVLI